MTENQLNNLRIHVLQIAYSLIDRISYENVVVAVYDEKNITPDPVSSHHLIELLSEINAGVFSHYCYSLFGWLSNPDNGYSAHPFTLDSFSSFCKRNDDNNKIFKDHITKQQLSNGSIPVYTSLVQGGDFFSTLWASKILIKYDKEYFEPEISKALEYLVQQKDIAARNNSQMGFLLYNLIKFSNNEYNDEISRIAAKLSESLQKREFSENLVEAINQLYVLEDLLEYSISQNNSSLKSSVSEVIISLFELDKEPKIPSQFEKYASKLPQSLYFHFILKAAHIGQKLLLCFNMKNIDLDLNSELHANYRRIKYVGQQHEYNLAYYKEHYGQIAKEFSNYEEDLEKMWESTESSYGKSIFLMMPFRSNLNFRTLTKEIKDYCKSKGFRVFRVDDTGRSPKDTLWDNIVLNMLGCKYGISIYVSDKSIDKMTDELRFFENPNVALEFGFMKSRGKKVLILKDKESKTPSDLQGFIWRPFDLDNPDKTIPQALKGWLEEIEKENTPHNNSS